MKKLKFTLFALGVLAFISCSGDGGDSHTHSYSTTWKNNDTSHWKECSCGAKSEEAAHTEGIWTVDIEATETSKGIEKTTCTVCQKELTKETPMLEHTHTWNRVSGTATTRTEGTTTYKCAGCSETKIESGIRIVPETAISLDILGAKSIIADADLEKYGISTTSIPAKMDGATYYKFGVYPQTIKAAEVTVDETIINLEFDEVDYYLGSDNNWYAKCTENANGSGYTYSDGTPVSQIGANSTKYFKVESIVWRKLEGSGYLLAERELTANVAYYPYYNVNRTIDSKTVYPNNYEHSLIRAFLNGYKYVSKKSDSSVQIDNEDFYNKGFLQMAFTVSQRNQIQTTEVDNSADSTTDAGNNMTKATTYVCSNTQDKIFLLSELEVTTTSNGFAAYNSYGVGSSRIRMPTDYAKANYAYQSSTTGYGGYWWLRSPYYDYSYFVRYVYNDGDANYFYNYVYNSNSGVVPALSVTE